MIVVSGTAMLIALMLAALSGCSGDGSDSHPESTVTGHGPRRPSSSGPPHMEPSPSIPAGGQKLSTFGIANGPQDTFSLPASAVIAARSDRPALVEVAVNSPKAKQMYRYLTRALPAAGFTIDKRHRSATSPAISFGGNGWTGKFTGHGSTSGITLRPSR